MSATPQPEADLVKVFDTQQESEAMVVHGLLTSAGIQSLVTSIDADQALWPGLGGVVVMVDGEHADDARRIIEEYNGADPEMEEIEEEETEGGG
jgi:hypothetical protein